MALSIPERNLYFYGKLLDVEQLEKEQRYFNRKRWLLNRLVTGSGVVCGLNVVPGENGEVIIQPGVAIDAMGREIVVVDEHSLDPSWLTDLVGDPSELLTEGDVEICLAYREVQADPVPVLVPDCDTPDGCAHGTVREEFVVLVRQAGDVPEPLGCGLEDFPVPADGTLHERLCQRIRSACPDEPEGPADTCVPLARVTLPVSGEESISPCTGTSFVFNNALLYELLLCLAGRQTVFPPGRILRYAFGDNQVAPAGSTLSDALGVEVIDGDGNPVADITVEFEVIRGGGHLRRRAVRDAGAGISRGRETRSLSVKTKKDGRASVSWTLGPKPGPQELIARAVGTPMTVTFRATATET